MVDEGGEGEIDPEDRVYDETAGKQVLYAATGRGVATVDVSGDRVGRFRLVRECEARDVAAGGGWLLAATAADVLVRDLDDPDAGWVETGFGPAVAVGVDGGDLLAAGPQGTLGRVVDDDPGEWLAVAEVDGTVRAVDGSLVGASDGVYRFTPGGVVDVGLDDVRDVSAAGAPLAATGDGLFRLGNGWLRELDGGVDVVDAAAGDDGLERAHAAAGDHLYEYVGAAGGEVPESAWRERPVPVAPVVAVAHGDRTYALTADGTVLADRGDGWARRALGLPDATALVVGE